MRPLFIISVFVVSAVPTLLAEQDGDWQYIIENGEATITSYLGTGGDVTIPEQVNGTPVKQIGINWPEGSIYPNPPVFGFNNTSVTSVYIPNSVQRIGDAAFSYCWGLNSVIIGTGITNIPKYTFQICANLSEVEMPNSITEIGFAAFQNCPKIQNINLPNNLKKISSYAFYGCDGLSIIIFPAKLENLEDASFLGCTNLSRAEFYGDCPTYSNSPFGSSNFTIYYNPNAAGWGSYFAGCPTAVLEGYSRLSIIFDTTRGTLLNPSNYSSSKAFFPNGEDVLIQVSAKLGYVFSGWTGSTNTTENPRTIQVSTDEAITAQFLEDVGDNDNDGLTNFQESITYGTNPNQKDTNSDGIEDGQAVTLGYSPTFNFSALLGYLQSHPPTGLYTTLQYTGNYAAGQTAGRAEVTSFPASYNLYTTGQIQNMAIGDLVLTRDSDGKFTLEYNIEQSEDLQNWSVYSSNTQVVRLSPNKAFVRIKAKQ